MFQISFTNLAESFDVSFSPEESLDAKFENTIEVPVGEVFKGSYDVTPTDEDQTLSISGMVASKDIVIRAVPNQHYGRLIWNGSCLTIY